MGPVNFICQEIQVILLVFVTRHKTKENYYERRTDDPGEKGGKEEGRTGGEEAWEKRRLDLTRSVSPARYHRLGISRLGISRLGITGSASPDRYHRLGINGSVSPARGQREGGEGRGGEGGGRAVQPT
jgi:hypothetical protein